MKRCIILRSSHSLHLFDFLEGAMVLYQGTQRYQRGASDPRGILTHRGCKQETENTERIGRGLVENLCISDLIGP